LLVTAQFIARGLSLTIPLHVAHLPGIEASAAMSGIIISVAAAGAALSSSVVARLSIALPIGRLLFVQFLIGGALCSALALATNARTLLVLRTLVALCLGGALTLASTLGAMITPGARRGAAV